jgi:hypothetical protein
MTVLPSRDLFYRAATCFTEPRPVRSVAAPLETAPPAGTSIKTVA